MSKGGNTVQVVRNLCAPLAEELEVYVWDIRYVKEGATWFLKVAIDKDGGVTVNDCEQFHRNLNKVLDEEDPIPGSYWLEVSSPGIERELTQDWHFEKLQGQLIQVNLIRPVEGEKLFVGELTGKDEEGIHLLLDEETEMCVGPKEAAWVRQFVDFNEGE